MKGKKFLNKVLVIGALLVSCTLITACQSEKANQEGEAVDQEVVDESTDESTTVDESVEVTSVRILDPSLQFAEGDDIENNKWTRSIMDEYGIKVSYKWTTPTEQFAEKRSLMLSTGDLPDFFYLDSTGFEQAVASDMLYDLTEVFEEYASDELKARMQIDENALNAGTVDGKLYALPQASDSLTNDIMMLWIRQDWLDNLGLEVPTTVDEMIAVAEAF